MKSEEIVKILKEDLIFGANPDLAETKLLATAGLRKFLNGLRTEKEKDDFRRHLRRYMQIYLPDCPFEVSTTNRYTIFTHEASVTARRYIKKGQPIEYLSGIQVLISPKEEEEISKRKKDFSIVVSSRSKCASLFMGPARFANHDCDANAQLKITSQSMIEIYATKNIEAGDEITVTYGDNYFGENNSECLCHTCEKNLANGWAQPHDATIPVQRSIEEETTENEGYTLRRRRRGDSTTRSSRTPSVTPGVRPKVRKSASKVSLRTESGCLPTADSPAPETLLREKRKREYESLTTPPVTPAKRLKTLDFDASSTPAPLTRQNSEVDSVSDISEPIWASVSDSGSTETGVTDMTSSDVKAAQADATAKSPTKPAAPLLKVEESETSLAVVPPPPAALEAVADESIAAPGDVALATGIPGGTAMSSQTSDNSTEPVEVIVIPPPLTPASKPAEQLPPTPPSVGATTEEAPAKRARGRPKRNGNQVQNSSPQACAALRGPGDAGCTASVPAKTKHRTPGDYTLTPLLLSLPDSAWINCMVCTSAFVQQDAYFTKSACPRCERHSMLYGYQWPKTQKEGKNDKEERIMDHRTIHRFLHYEEEARVRGRKTPSCLRQASEAKSRRAALQAQRKRVTPEDAAVVF